MHGIFVCDSFTKLRLQTICCFLPVVLLRGYAGLAVEFAYRTLKNDAEVFPDECRVIPAQLQCCVNTQRIQLFRQSASYSPDLTNWLQPQ